MYIIILTILLQNISDVADKAFEITPGSTAAYGAVVLILIVWGTFATKMWLKTLKSYMEVTKDLLEITHEWQTEIKSLSDSNNTNNGNLSGKISKLNDNISKLDGNIDKLFQMTLNNNKN